jgi:hypothetical protein
MKKLFLIIAFLTMTAGVQAEEKPKVQKPKAENRHREHRHNHHDHWSFGFGFSDHHSGFSFGIGPRHHSCWVPGHYETRIETIMTYPSRWEKVWNGEYFEWVYYPPVYETRRISIWVSGYWGR